MNHTDKQKVGAAVRLDGVTKRFGRTRALDALSFEVPRGAICGLVGPNGSGKTTSMGVIAGLLRPQTGTVDLFGRGPFSIEIHGGKVGMMPQDSTPSPYSPIGESLRYYAMLAGFSNAKAEQEVGRCLELVRLSERARSKYGALSHGMRRRFSLAQALLGQPELILLDEPTSGLDPELAVEIRNLIASFQGHATVLVSSHLLSELDMMCDHVIFVEKGTCVRQGPLRQIVGQDALVRFELSQKPRIAQLESALPGCSFEWTAPILEARIPAEREIEDVISACLRALLDDNVGIRSVVSGDTLESAYMKSLKRS